MRKLSLALLVSGRASFEIVQKARAAGIPFVGFLRGDSFNVCAGAHRVSM